MDELTREFLIESREGLDPIERCLTDLEKRPTDSAPITEIRGWQRSFGIRRIELRNGLKTTVFDHV
jgi:hypothetical protein